MKFTRNVSENEIQKLYVKYSFIAKFEIDCFNDVLEFYLLQSFCLSQREHVSSFKTHASGFLGSLKGEFFFIFLWRALKNDFLWRQNQIFN